MKALFYLFLSLLGWQDAKTYYLSFYWTFPAVFFLVWWIIRYSISWENLGCALYFSLPAFLASRKGWMGQADGFFLFYFGFLLGFPRMMVAVCLSVMIGICWVVFLKIRKKEPLVPYVTCLCISVMMAYAKGYYLYSHIVLNLASFLLQTSTS